MSLKIGVIVSTTRPTRVGRHVADWFMSQVPKNDDVGYELIDLKEENLPFLSEPESPSTGKYELESSKAWSKKIAGFDGFVIVTAEYNYSMPAPLKNALDSLYHEWAKKPVVFVGYGTYGAVRAVEQLVNVVTRLGMVPLTQTFVGILSPWEAVSPDGQVKQEFVVGNLEGMVDNLTWWAKLLQDAR